MSEMKPSISSGRKFSAVWIVPLVALVIGLSMAIHHVMTQGPTITIDFKTAESLQGGKTQVRLLNVDIGVVESVALKEDMSGVTATVKLGPEARPLLHEDTRFWVVRPRVGAGGVSGLSTLLGGTYIEMSPGVGSDKQREFVGLEEPPQTPLDAPGVRLTLLSKRAGSLSVGESVVFRGYNVGRIESMEFDEEGRQVRYDIFVDAPFHKLINSNTRFWNVSGISLKASAEGIQVEMGTMDTLLLGGVAFDAPPGLRPGSAVDNGREYLLYDSYDDILKNPYKHGLYYVVSFTQSVRGLEPGAPVVYRGIPIGRVERILLKELSADNLSKVITVEGLRQENVATGQAIPVLIYLEPGRMELPDNQTSITILKQLVESGVPKGLRATLMTGNLLTGKQLISVDYYPDEEPAELGEFEQYVVIPTIETGVVRLEQQLRGFLDRLDALPLEETVAGVNKVLDTADNSLASLTKTLDSANSIIGSDDTKRLSSELVATLGELRSVLTGITPDSEMYQGLGSTINSLNGSLENLDALIRKVSDKPNSLIFSSSPEMDPIPEARP
ncbi:MAG: intermembrane transport protein PqiB [Porticoccus sp.]|nr:intermembrane transport protein PqiB [Porticoccus sp.]